MKRILPVAVVLALVGCTAHRVLRPIAAPIDTSATELQTDVQHRRTVAARSIERHVGGGQAFELAVIELDDQGWLWNPRQLTTAIDRTEQAAGENGPIMVVFFHGWKNNAEVCNEKIVCFRDALWVLAKQEDALARQFGVAPRPIVGFYPSWRGSSVKFPQNFSFFGRKETAHRVGRAGAVEIVAELSALYDRLRETKRGTRLVFIGHSFGAAILYEASATYIRTSLVAAQGRPAVSGCEPVREEIQPVPALGDVMVLVNPAFEASLYHDVDVRAHWFDRFSRKQTPVLLTVSSEGDGATRTAFPIGRWVSTIAQRTRGRDQRDALGQTIGNYKPFLTHTLTLTGAVTPAPSGSRQPCECPVDLKNISIALEPPTVSDPCDIHLGATSTYGPVTLTKTHDLVHADNPFNVVTASREVIGDHDGIFTAPFFEFLVRYVSRIDLKKRLLQSAVQ